MTKTVEWLNQTGTPDWPEEKITISDDEDGNRNEFPIEVHVHYMRCMVHTLEV